MYYFWLGFRIVPIKQFFLQIVIEIKIGYEMIKIFQLII